MESRLDQKAIGQRIRQRRTFLNMSREDLARKIGITQTFLTDIELGTKGFSLKSLERFCEALKMSSDSILFGKSLDEKEKHTALLDILEHCPDEKKEYAERMMMLFLMSHETTNQ
ncbi:helix-turn-helix transcriptional regulator [Eubacterium sp. 1001713B170207_170306_E7]|uniref:helix-turn-helix domain-containing protein n=1 Tax=Eubacterium sp. 1001713B170207_170306_E7 TaxID=2787097 RepID=UPI0018976FD0|nr:helix-turn-helix transcriptional regulator [Eubacterium sp. 1001713B170207_170306_E7]